MKRNRLQEAEMAVLLISLFLCKFIIPQSEFITNKKPPIKGRRLPMKAILKTNTIITQKKPQQTLRLDHYHHVIPTVV